MELGNSAIRRSPALAGRAAAITKASIVNSRRAYLGMAELQHSSGGNDLSILTCSRKGLPQHDLSAPPHGSYDETMRQVGPTILFFIAACAAAHARDVDPRQYGIDLTPGPILAGESQAVTTTDTAGEGIIGRIHVRVGDGAVVLLPDGQLVARKAGQFGTTDRKFEP